jgi:hypothetical protein
VRNLTAMRDYNLGQGLHGVPVGTDMFVIIDEEYVRGCATIPLLMEEKKGSECV